MTEWAIVCDFDGTIVVDDVMDVLLQRFGRAGWQDLELDWRAGRIGSRQCMAGQVSLLDMDRSELDACLSGFDIDPAFGMFVEASRAAGVPICIASDGLDIAITSILERYGLSEVRYSANHLEAIGTRGWQLHSPNGCTGCDSGTCKCAVATEARGSDRQILLIGDGASDFCASAHADLIFSKPRLTRYCRAHGLPHVPIHDFSDATVALRELLAQSADMPASSQGNISL